MGPETGNTGERQARDARAPFTERRTGAADRRRASRAEPGSSGRRFTDHLGAAPHLICRKCGERWITELVRKERFEVGEGCPRCGGRLEPVTLSAERSGPGLP
jgi:hypothetical protein